MNYFEVLIPTASAVLLGGVIGFERQVSGHFAGLRTHMLVSLGAAIFALDCSELSAGTSLDLTRVIQGIMAEGMV